MGNRYTKMENINPDAIREAITKGGFNICDMSEIVGNQKNYISSCLNRGVIEESKLKSIARVLRIDYNDLLQTEKEKEPPKTRQNGAGALEQAIRINSRLDDIEKELRRLQAMEMRQEKLVNQFSAFVETTVKWTDIFEKTKIKATGCETNLLRLLALLEGKKRP